MGIAVISLICHTGQMPPLICIVYAVGSVRGSDISESRPHCLTNIHDAVALGQWKYPGDNQIFNTILHRMGGHALFPDPRDCSAVLWSQTLPLKGGVHQVA